MDINSEILLSKQSMTEFKIQVDRRRLEEMITGEILGENAESFFNRIEQITGVKVCWPSRLKIKAKTKKDVIIKLIGNNSLNIQNATKLIEEKLRIKKEKVTLKMEISHCLHSQIIGRLGRNTQQIMRDTGCHIHFPDSNKILTPIILPNSKNDQVSISGFIKDVEKAREMLRASVPLTISVNIQLSLSRSLHSIQPRLDPVNLQRHLPCNNNNDLSIQFTQNTNFGSLHFIMRSNTKNELEMLKVFGRICQLIGIFPTGEELFCYSQFEIRSSAFPSLNSIRWIAFRTNTQIQLNSQGLLISGQIEGIFVARKFITGLLPVILQFEKANKLTNQSNSFLRILESELDLQIFEKRKRKITPKINEKEGINLNNNNCEKEYIITTYEANLFNAYLARNRLLQLNDLNKKEFSEKFKENEQFPQDNDKAALMRSLCRESLLADQQLPLPSSSILSLSINENNNIIIQQTNKNKLELNNNNNWIENNKLNCNKIVENEEPKSPDPQESPIAAGLLAGAKSVNLQKGEFRKILDYERLHLRNAAITSQSIFGNTFQENNKLNQQSLINSNNDIFAIYGFSNSLPTELFRNNNSKKNIWQQNEEENKKLKGRPIVGRGNKEEENIKEEKKFSTNIIFNKNISLQQTCSSELSNNNKEEEKEEEEINNNKKQNNNTKIEIKKATALVHPRVAALQASSEKFTMSAGNYCLFKINNNNNENNNKQSNIPPISPKWDIRILIEPSIILKQLGLSEYIKLFNEQEIDMQAFLLLDEQCLLNNLGISKLGARKKIMHAITKLRESANLYGIYSL